MQNLTLDKPVIRTQLRAILDAMTVPERHERSVAASSHLLSTPEFVNARVIMLYLSMHQEVETAPICLRAWQEGKSVVVPRIFWGDHAMMPIEIHSLTSNLKTDQMGLQEPIAGQPIPVEFIDLVIVPGLGFGPLGQRIGRGAGFYDRFLSQSGFHGTTCGLAFEKQILTTLPMLPHDVCLDMLITDTGIRRFPVAGTADANVHQSDHVSP